LLLTLVYIINNAQNVEEISMKRKTFLSLMTFILITSLVLGGTAPARAQNANMPASPTDGSKVPHYFGPWPNWANSPFTLPQATVEISGDGSGATATATVDWVGAITAINVTNPGSGYTIATVNITGSGTGATADAVITTSGVVTAVNVDAAGAGYTSPSITISGGGASTDAMATAYGAIDAVTIIDGGSGYTMPTVEFDLPDAPDGVTAKAHAEMDANGTITAVVVDTPGSGYLHAPNVAIHNGTLFDPIDGATQAAASATLMVTSVVLDTFGAGYTSAPTVTFSDMAGTGDGATATAFTDVGALTGINVTNPGSGYLSVGMRKFIDDLPGMCTPPACPTTGKYIPLAVAEPKVYNGVEADEYVIGLVQYRTSFSSDLPPTLVRGYVQLETAANAAISQHFPVTNELLNGTKVPVMVNGVQAYAVTPPQWLGPIIAATKDKPVRIVFRNLLPTGSNGDLFLPVDSTMMGSGMGPMNMMMPMDNGTVMDKVRNPDCNEYPKSSMCFKDDRATLHLHGGITPWISDGTPHQWITPADENTSWPQGVSVQNVPDMNVCGAANDGCQTFYYTNQQSARLMFYHDHAWGITRLNVYAGEAAGYLISDNTEKALISSGTIPADQIPLIVQDRTFVPDAAQLALQDPTWDTTRWGTKGSFWYHHVYMPAQNPGDPSGMSAYGRWMYGPWFWPPAADTVYGPIDNPYYDPNCNLDDPATWQYDTDPFCEPKQIPGTPNISAGMEQFNDTPVVNGVAYPKVTLDPKSYRLRILNAANDRFFNFQWYVADPTQGNGLTEVALKSAELEAAQTDPNVFPTPDTTISLPGPDWIQIGTEGGFLPAPVVVDGQQPTTWITDPTRFDVGNVDKHSLLLAPAERADVIVDFSKFAGKTLILYNDAPAAFPARVASYDYYTGAPDLQPVGAPSTLPGYGPNTRTIMQVTIAGTPAPAFSLTKLQNAFKHNANGTGVFESGQHPIIVGQAAYNTAYGTAFAASSNCNAPGSTLQRCDGLVRVNDTTTFSFNTLRAPTTNKVTMPLQPKAIHDETNATTFDEYGRMQANLGVEAQPPSPGAQNVTLYPYVNPSTELIDATNLPKNDVTYDANGKVVSDIKITPIANAGDGTQIWRITHNGVDTHPIHFHLYDVQLINRVTWDNIIIPPDANELGWKDTVRVSPLEDTIVALRPIIPELPFELPNSIRPLNPMMPLGSTAMFNNVDPQGNPTAAIANQLVNFGWEYVYHCHILSHEEMDMMRPVSVALPPVKPDGLVYTVSGTGNIRQLVLTWNDNSITETAFVVQKSTDAGVTWTDLGTLQSPLNQPNTHGTRSFTDTAFNTALSNQYRVVARNTVGYGAEFPSMTVQSVSAVKLVDAFPPSAPSGLSAAAVSPTQVNLNWTDTSGNETGFTIQRALVTGGVTGSFTAIDGVGANIRTYSDITVSPATTYAYRVIAFNTAGNSSPSNVATVTTLALGPTAPSNLTATALLNPNRIQLSWRDNSNNENNFQVWRSVNGGAFTNIATVTRTNAQRTSTGGTVTYTNNNLTAGSTYSYYVVAVNTVPNPDQFSSPSNTASATILGIPAAPSGLTISAVRAGTFDNVNMNWVDNSNNETSFSLQCATNPTFTANLNTFTIPANTTTYLQTGAPRGLLFYCRVQAVNAAGSSAFSNTASTTTP
jgi:FtsP/CotA-like multicopper oxidase with cupredoxin domain